MMSEKTGQFELEYLYNLPIQKLKEKIQDILGKETFSDEWIKNSQITKISVNDIPHKIKIEWYDFFEINSIGIEFHPEIGTPKLLRNFDKYFKIK